MYTLLCNNEFATPLFSAHAIFADMSEGLRGNVI